MKNVTLAAVLMLFTVLNCLSQEQFYDTSFGANGVTTYPNEQGNIVKINKINDKLYGLSTILGNDIFIQPKDII